jgi:pimeloyl-ACP methyl ester carboxylesterase
LEKPQFSSDLTAALAADRKYFATRHGTRIAYYSDLNSSGRPLILVHSINAAPSAIEMKPLFDHYRSSRPVYAPELPGFGASERNNQVYNPTFYAECLCDFIADIDDADVDVIALSLSCEFVARATNLAPDKFHSLTFVSPTGLGKRQPPGDSTSRKVQSVLGKPWLGSSLFRLLTSRPSIRYFLNQSFVNKAPDELVDYAYQTSHQPNAQYAPFAFLSGSLFTQNATASLYNTLSIPVLVLYDQDIHVSFDHLPELTKSRSNWQAARIKPSRGLPHFEDLESVTRELDQFWSGQETGSETDKPENSEN